MAEASPLQSAGLAVHHEAAPAAAALRYFAPAGEFAAALRGAGAPLPSTGEAIEAGRDLILAWCAPGETLCLSGSEARLQQLKRAAAAASDGCLIELTGGLSVVHVAGTRIEELLSRLGGSASTPAAGEARRSRLADVPVLALCVRAQEVRLVVDRAYAEHLLGWIGATLQDFPRGDTLV